MKKHWILAILLFWYCYSSGQYSDSTQYYVGLASTGVLNKTNTARSYVLTNSAKFGIRKKRVSLNSMGGWIYGNNETGLINNDVTVTVDGNYASKVKNFYYWILGNYTSSYSLNINHQFQLGLGAAYDFINSPGVLLNLSEGVLLENSDLLINSVQDKYNTIRNSLRVRCKVKIGDLLLIDGTSFWQPSLQYREDYIIRSTTNITLKLRKWLGITSAFTYNRFNRTDKENLLFNYGITIDKYF